MCKLEGIKWVVIKSNKKVSKNLAAKINRIRNVSVIDNYLYFYGLKSEAKNRAVEVLKTYKKLKFEVVEFYDKQFGLTENRWNFNDEKFEEVAQKLPLNKKFYWHNPGADLKTVTPITNKQFSNIILIN